MEEKRMEVEKFRGIFFSRYGVAVVIYSSCGHLYKVKTIKISAWTPEVPSIAEKLLAIDGYWGMENHCYQSSFGRLLSGCSNIRAHMDITNWIQCFI